MPYLEITEAVLVLWNVVNNDYQKDLSVLYTFVPNKLFGQLLDILSKRLAFLKTFISEFSYIEIWFTDQNSKPLNILSLVINYCVTCKNDALFNWM